MRFGTVALSAIVSSSLLAVAGGAAAAGPQVLRPAANRAVSLVASMPLRNVPELTSLIALQSNPSSPMYHHWLTAPQFRAAFGAPPATMRAAVRSLQRHGFTVTATSTQLIHFTGSAGVVERAFATKTRYSRFAVAHRRSIVADGAYRVPVDLAVTGAKILNLGETPVAQPASVKEPDNRYSAAGPYWFDDLKQAYQYPIYQQASGKGIAVATVGYGDYSPADAAQYFNTERLGGAHPLAPAPTTEPFYAGQTTPVPFDPNDGNDVESDIDVQQAGGSAPGATIVAIKDTGSPSFLGAFDQVAESTPPLASIVSISYLLCETIQTAPVNPVDGPQSLDAYHAAFMQGNSEGVTYVAASGDNGGAPCGPPATYEGGTGTTYAPVPGVSSYANDPNVTGVGGTNLQTTMVSGKLNSAYVSESEYATQFDSPQATYGNYLYPVYFGSGGGVSSYFAEPDYQKAYGLKYAGRAVPDVSMHMGGCPHSTPSMCQGNESGDESVIGGSVYRILGTSLSAPEFAGLLAVKEGALGTAMGNENYDLYALAAKQGQKHYFHNGIPGNNGVVGDINANGSVHFGYNTIVGLGTPIAISFINDPSSVFDAAGIPQTTGNP